MGRPKKMTKTQVRESLIRQLTEAGANREHFMDLISDYMELWTVKEGLIKDIKSRGVTYQDYSSTGTLVWKNNPSVKELVLVNRQMMLLLKELGLSTQNLGGGGEDDNL